MRKSKSDAALTASPAAPVPAKLNIRSLQEIRDKAIQEQFSTSQTIAELDALRNEIDATLAFLRARDR